MNLSELYTRLINALAETSTPEYWTEAELKQYLNEALQQFNKDAGFNPRHRQLYINTKQANSFLVPDDCYSIKDISYNGKSLQKKSLDYIRVKYAGKGNIDEINGIPTGRPKNWRSFTGEPVYWFYENGGISLFPKAVKNTELFAAKNIIAGIVKKNETTVYLASKIPSGLLSKTKVDVFINGVYQAQSAWNFGADADTLVLASVVSTSRDAAVTVVGTDLNSIETDVTSNSVRTVMAAGSMDAELPIALPEDLNNYRVDVYVNGIHQNPNNYRIDDEARSILHFDESLSDSALVFVDIKKLNGSSAKIEVTLSAGSNTVNISSLGYNKSIHNIRVFHDGIAIDESCYGISGNSLILGYTLTDSSTVEVVRFDKEDMYNSELSMDYYAILPALSANTDVPAIPLAFHSAIWELAAYYALTKEGKKTQDVQKAQIFLSLYQKDLANAKDMITDDEIDFAPEVYMPFFL